MQLEKYEFGNKDNKLIFRLSNDMRFVGIFLKVVGCMGIFGGVLTGWLDGDWESNLWDILLGGLHFFIGIWTVEAASSFHEIAASRGKDIENLLKGLEQIKKLYKFVFWVLCANFALFIILVLILSLFS